MSGSQSPVPCAPSSASSSASFASRRCLELAEMGSEIRKTFAQGEELRRKRPELDLIDLSLGNPDLEPPDAVHDAMLHLLRHPERGQHRYMDNAGYAGVRAFVAGKLSKSEGVEIGENQVFLTVGAAGALQILLRFLLDPGDEALLLAPFFSEYQPYVSNLAAVPVVVPPGPGFVPDLEAIAARLTPRTRLLFLNTPNNPSGVAYPPDSITALAALLEEHRRRTGRLVHLVSDEPYARLLFRGKEPVQVLKAYPYAWLVRSHSKDLGLAGERIGYLAWGAKLAQADTLPLLRNAARCTGFVNAPALMQRILPQCFDAKVDVGIYEERAKAFVRILTAGGMECVSPGGGFFVFPRAPIPDCRAFCRELLEREAVLCVPGAGFGSPGFFRASLTQPIKRVNEAAERIVRVAEAYRR